MSNVIRMRQLIGRGGGEGRTPRPFLLHQYRRFELIIFLQRCQIGQMKRNQRDRYAIYAIVLKTGLWKFLNKLHLHWYLGASKSKLFIFF